MEDSENRSSGEKFCCLKIDSTLKAILGVVILPKDSTIVYKCVTQPPMLGALQARISIPYPQRSTNIFPKGLD